MLFQLTTAGRSLINTNGLLTSITKVEFGDAYNYVPASNPTGLTGTKVYESTLTFSPVAVNTNTMRFTTYLPKAVGPFTFGEVALWSGSTLIGVGSNTIQITKVADADGADYRVDIYVDLLASQRFASWEVVSAFTRNFFPRLQSVDVLFPPEFDTNNAYVIYGDGSYNSAFLAFSDMSGQWAFSGKPKIYFSGTIISVGSTNLSSTELNGATYNGNANELVIQFTDGAQRGYCRRVSTLSNGSLTWSTVMQTLPAVGDSFIVLGPSVASNFNGTHASLGGLQGGSSNERYHLTQEEQGRVVEPRFKTVKTVGEATYTILNTDNDAYITLTGQPAVTITLNDSTFTTFPIGGAVMFRYINTDITLSTAGGTTMDPFNTINIPIGSGTFAVVKRAAGTWDYMATVAEEETFDGNVRHKYPDESGTRSIGTFVPMYSMSGDEDGPVCDITSSKLSLTEFGGFRMWSGSLDDTPVWNSPAVILIGISGGPTGSSSTGLQNNSTSYTCSGLINGLNFTVSIMGSNAQTYTQLLSAFNTQLNATLGSSTIASLTLNGYGLVLATNVGGSSQSITLSDYGIFNALTNVVSNFRVSHNGATNAVNDMSSYMNFYDSATNNNRIYRSAFGALVMGLQNSVSGQSGYSLGGAYNFASGNYSGIIGGTTNRVNGFYCTIQSGYGNTIWVPPTVGNSSLTPQFSIIENSERSVIETKGSATTEADIPLFNNVGSSSNVKSTGSYVNIQTSNTVTCSGLYSTVIGCISVTVAGFNANVLGSRTVSVTSAASYVNIVASEDITVTGHHVNVAGVKTLNSSQSSVNYLPNGTTHIAGKPALTFQITTGGYGADPALALTTDGGGLLTTNRMVVPTGEAWIIDANVIVNYPSGYKGWKVHAGLKNVGGTVTIQFLDVQEQGSTNALNMSVSLLVGAGGDANKVHFAVNTRNDTNSGYQSVSASSLATVTAARALA